MANVVLVLGAGASKPFGFPLGGELRSEIIRNLGPQYYRSGGVQEFDREIPCLYDVLLDCAYSRQDIERFLYRFKSSLFYSIDRFLGTANGRNIEIGKCCISYFIKREEFRHRKRFERGGTSDLDLQEGIWDGDWMGWFFNEALNQLPAWGANKKVSILTFNYDRSYEYYWYQQAHQFYSPEALNEAYGNLDIIHLYGVAGEFWKNAKPVYGCDLDVALVHKCSQELKVIPAERGNIEPSAEFQKARRLIQDAEQVVFLGFGFDETNLRLLGYGEIGLPKFQKTYASCLGLSFSAKQRTTRMFATSGRKIQWAGDSQNSYEAFRDYWF